MLEKSIISVGKNLPNLPIESVRTHQQRSRRTVLLKWQEHAGVQRQQPQRRDGAEAVEHPAHARLVWEMTASRRHYGRGRASATAWKEGTNSHLSSSMALRAVHCWVSSYDARAAYASGQFSPRAVETRCSMQTHTCPSI